MTSSLYNAVSGFSVSTNRVPVLSWDSDILISHTQVFLYKSSFQTDTEPRTLRDDSLNPFREGETPSETPRTKGVGKTPHPLSFDLITPTSGESGNSDTRILKCVFRKGSQCGSHTRNEGHVG